MIPTTDWGFIPRFKQALPNLPLKQELCFSPHRLLIVLLISILLVILVDDGEIVTVVFHNFRKLLGVRRERQNTPTAGRVLGSGSKELSG